MTEFDAIVIGAGHNGLAAAVPPDCSAPTLVSYVYLSTSGKVLPLADPSTQLRFNLSHSDGLAVVVLSKDLEVGVDVERIKPRRKLLSLARRALTPAEAAEVEAAVPEDRLAVFHAAWARREATAKCFGVGLHAPLPSAAVAVADLDAWPGFAAAVAVAATTVPPLRCFTLDPA